MKLYLKMALLSAVISLVASACERLNLNNVNLAMKAPAVTGVIK